MRYLFIFYLIFIQIALKSQDYPYEIEKYPFVKNEKNHLIIYDSLPYIDFYNKLTDIGFKGQDKVSIVHIGDSHLQADFLSGHFRRKLQTFFLGAIGGRGFIFPYAIAKTNNPINYKVQSNGKWESCRNVENKIKCPIGLAGIMVYTNDSLATVSISIDDNKLPGYDFDKLMVFHGFDDDFYVPYIENAKLVKPNPELGYTLFEFENNIDRILLQVRKTNRNQNKFNLYGFNFDSRDAGIIYHTIGVNGAEYESYLKCELFEPHLKALKPDWIIVSLGTNDAYKNNFNTTYFELQVEKLIENIKNAAPNAAILLVTPADHRFKKAFVNEHVKTVSEVIKQEAKKYHLSVWDFNEIMGGFGSVNHWYYNGMAHTDFLHFTQKGYEFQAQLLFNAFLRAYDDYLIKKILNK